MTLDELGTANTEGNFIELVEKASMHFHFLSLGAGESLVVDFMGAGQVPPGQRSSPPKALGAFPLRHVRDYRERLPGAWVRHGGVLLLPMHDQEALFLSFTVHGNAQYAVRVGSGKLCAITGRPWSEGLQGERGVGQDYILPHRQGRLDGFGYSKTLVQQFVAVPLGRGETVEERLSGRAEHGGLQLQVYPMAKDRYLEMEERRNRAFIKSLSKSTLESMEARLAELDDDDFLYDLDPGIYFFGKHPLCEGVDTASRQNSDGWLQEDALVITHCEKMESSSPAQEPRPGDQRYQEMGLAAGGKIRQSLKLDRNSARDYDREESLRVFVHILNSAEWRYVTGEELPGPGEIR